MAAKNKKKGGRQGIVSKLMNVALIALGFARPLSIIIRKPNMSGVEDIVHESTFGLATGKFNWKAGAKFYSPAGAAIALGKLKSYLIKQFPVRR